VASPVQIWIEPAGINNTARYPASGAAALARKKTLTEFAGLVTAPRASNVIDEFVEDG
jgi:hypothetical protein